MAEDEVEVVSWTAAQCAGCRALRRRCVPGCIFAPYFPADDDPSRFAAVHRVFGASNAARMLGDAAELPGDRRRAADTLVAEAWARVRDPALGCVSYLTVLQMLVEKAREQVDGVREEIAREFGTQAASEPVDLAAAQPEAKLEAMRLVERALGDARKRDAEMLAARDAMDLRWWQLCQAVAQAGESPRVPGGRGEKDRDASKQMVESENTVAAAEESSGEQTTLMPQAAAGTEPAISEDQQSIVTAEAAREEALTSEQQAPAAALQHHDSATGQLAGTGTGFLDRQAAEEFAKKLDAMIRETSEAQHYHGPAVAHYTPMGLDVTPRLKQPHQPQELQLQMAAARQEAEREEASRSEQASAAALQRHDSATARLAGAGTGFLDGHAYMDPVATQYASMGLDVAPRLQHPPQPQETVPKMVEAQQQAAALELVSNRDLVLMLMPHLAAAEQGMMMQLLAAGAPQFDDPAAQYDDTKLGITVGVAREPNMMAMRQLAAYTNAEHGSDSGATVAFQPPGSAEAAPFLVEQQQPPRGQTTRAALGLQPDPSLLPLLASLGQPHAQVSQQQSTDGADEGLSSDLTAYLYSLSR